MTPLRMVSDSPLPSEVTVMTGQQVGRHVADRRGDHERPGALRGCRGLRRWSAAPQRGQASRGVQAGGRVRTS